jgi:hypothetical protein
MPTTDVLRVLALGEECDGGSYNANGRGATEPRRISCSTYVELARRMGIRTDDAIRQFVELR